MASNVWTRLALVVVLAIGPGACAAQKDALSSGRLRAEDGVRSPLASYLAARFAASHGDTRAAADYYAQALTHDPENGELLMRAFTAHLAEGRMDEADALARRLLVYDADASLPLLAAGVAELRQGRFKQAEERFAAMSKRGVNAFLGPLAVAWSQLGQGKPEQALASIKPLAATPGTASLHDLHAALINDINGRPEQAQRLYEAALKDQLNIRTVEALGALYQRRGEMDKARALYGRYQEQHPDSLLFSGPRLLALGPGAPRPVSTPREGLAEALFDTATLMRQGSAPELAMIFARLALAVQPDFPLCQMLVADLLSDRSRLDEANAAYAAIDANSPVFDYGQLKIAFNMDEAGNQDGALVQLDALAARRPQALDALVAKGDVLRHHQRFAEAAAAYDRAVAGLSDPSPRHWTLFYARGIALERSRQWARAEQDFKMALSLNPDQPDVLNYLGYSWVEQGINLHQARAMIEKAAQLRPTDGAIVDSLGWALFRMSEYPEAVAALERAVELKPEDPTINDHLGDAYWRVGREEEARFQWRRALTLNPEEEQIKPLKAKLADGLPAARPAAH